MKSDPLWLHGGREVWRFQPLLKKSCCWNYGRWMNKQSCSPKRTTLKNPQLKWSMHTLEVHRFVERLVWSLSFARAHKHNIHAHASTTLQIQFKCPKEYSFFLKISSEIWLSRHLCYQLALKREKLTCSHYASFLFLREDNVFGSITNLTRQLYLEEARLYLSQQGLKPAVVISKFCPFGGVAEKIAFFNPAGVALHYSSSMFGFVRYMKKYYDHTLHMREPSQNTLLAKHRERIPFQMEQWLDEFYNQANFTTLPYDFGRIDGRYVNDVKAKAYLCTPTLYSTCCSSNTSAQECVIPACSTVFEPPSRRRAESNATATVYNMQCNCTSRLVGPRTAHK